MKKIILLFSFISLPAWPTTTVLLNLGESRSIPLQGSNQVWIQDKNIVEASAVGQSLRLRALKEGETQLKIGARHFKIQILHPQKILGQAALNSALQDIVGLRLITEDGSFVVKGHLHALNDLLKLQKRAKSKGFLFYFQAEMNLKVETEVSKYFQKLLEKAQLPPQNLTFVPQLEMRLQVDPLLISKYQKLLQSYGVLLVLDSKSVDMAPTVKVEITVAEVRRDLTKNWGLQWPDSYSWNLLDKGLWETEKATFSLHAMEKNGDLNILASPNILCRSGKEAEFLAGGEFPIKVFNYHTSDIVWKRYGILLRVKPVADTSGRISLSIETEISTIDPARTVDGVPGILTNRVSSHFDLAKPQTIALSGLLKDEKGRNSQGLPGLGKIPILGSLFSSKGFQDNKTELVIFVRPSIIQESQMGKSSPRHL